LSDGLSGRMEWDRPNGARVEVRLRLATSDDVPAIRELLADDRLGATREDLAPDALPRYRAAFEAIDDDPRNELWLACIDIPETGFELPLGMYQVTYIPYLSRGGNERALIEAVRVARDARNRGLGAWMMRHALRQAKARGCLLAQLTTDKTRDAAHRFYLRLGFANSHEGMKLDLTQLELDD